jgi:hypothetical protein
MLNCRNFISLVVLAFLLAGCAKAPEVNTMPDPFSISARLPDQFDGVPPDPYDGVQRIPKGSLRMQIKLVASRAGGTLAPGDLGWCVVELRNLSDKEITLHTVVFTGKVDTERTPSAVGGMTGYHGIGVAALAAKWSTERTSGQWRRLAPPDGPIILPPGKLMEFARLIQAPKSPGVYNLNLRLNTADAARALCTSNVGIQEESVCLEATIKATIVARQGRLRSR